MTLPTKDRACPLCGASNYELLFMKDGFEYARCHICRQVYVPKIPASNVHFEDEFFANRLLAPQDANPARADRMRRLTAEIRKRFGPRKDLKVLDVGCGKGWNLRYLREAGYEGAWGVDVNEEALEVAESHGIPVDHGFLHEIGYSEGQFDVVLSDQVIEHLEEPRPVLREIARILNPNGFFWCSVPNVDAWHIRLFLKQKHRHFAGDRHLNLSNPATFHRLLESSSLKPLRIDTYFEELTLQRLKGVLASPGDFGHAVITARKAEKDYAQTLAAAPPLRKKLLAVLTSPVNACLVAGTRALKAGAYLEAVAIKDR